MIVNYVATKFTSVLGCFRHQAIINICLKRNLQKVSPKVNCFFFGIKEQNTFSHGVKLPAQAAEMICTNVVSDVNTVLKNCFELAYA